MNHEIAYSFTDEEMILLAKSGVDAQRPSTPLGMTITTAVMVSGVEPSPEQGWVIDEEDFKVNIVIYVVRCG